MREKINAFFKVFSVAYLFTYAVALCLICIFFYGTFRFSPYLSILGLCFLYFSPFYFAFIELGTTIDVLFEKREPHIFESVIHALRGGLIFSVFFAIGKYSYYQDIAVHMALGWLILKALSLVLFRKHRHTNEFLKTRKFWLSVVSASILLSFALVALIVFNTFF